MSKIYVTGHKGMIGSQLIKNGCFPLDVDVRDIVAVDNEIAKHKPSVIIHLASKSMPDYCEQHPKESLDVNYGGSINVFSMAEKYKIPVVFVSSDHVYSGVWMGDYKESDEVTSSPKSIYALHKITTEGAASAFDNVKIVRTSTLIEKSRPSISVYLDAIRSGEDVYVPSFLWRSFMHLEHFCYGLETFATAFDKMPKLLNISGSKVASWWQLIYSYAEANGLSTRKIHRRLRESVAPYAPRPRHLGLNTNLSRKLGFRQYSYIDGILLNR